MIELRQTSRADVPALYELYELLGHHDPGYFERCLDEKRIILIASSDGKDVGFGVLNFHPQYALYKKLDIPEIQDLNVIPDARQKGIATTIVNKCEELAEEVGKAQIGISVPLTKSYGPAQRLYIKFGYMPDGNGVTYQREAVANGRHVPVDEDLCLMMIKRL